MSGEPLPSRILIPVANPLTAEELIRIGASLLEPRTGELTALGIVEVPEGMPLSEGATRARQARRLLQRVLDYAPEGTVIHPLVRIGRHAAAGIVEAAAEQEADLMIFGWGGKSGPGRDAPGGPAISPDHRRGRPRVARATSPSSSSAARAAIRRILVPVRGGPHAELALRFADALAHRHDATVVVIHLVPAGVTEAVRAQAEHALAAFVRQHVTARSEPLLRETRNVRTAILREAEHADLVVMGASAPPGEPGGALFGVAAGGDRPARQAAPSSSSRPASPSGARRSSSWPQKAETLAAADRAAEESRAVPARVDRWFAEANFHHCEFGDLAPAGGAQGEAGRHGQPRPADAQRGGDDRPDRRAGRSASCRSATRCSTRSSSSTRPPPTTPARSPRRRARASSQHPDVLPALRLVHGQGRGALEVALRDHRRHRRLGRHRRPQLAPPDGLRDARARCSWSRGCST